MATRTLTDQQFLEKLNRLGLPYWTPADLEKVLGQSRASLHVTIARLKKRGLLIPLQRGAYVTATQPVHYERIASQLYYPSYLSFETVLSRAGILSQIPYTLTFATTRLSKRLRLQDQEVEFRQLKEALFFGFRLEDGVYIAEPEKALLDLLYLNQRGWAKSETKEWSLASINRERLAAYAKQFPVSVQQRVIRIIDQEEYLGVR